MDIAGWRYKRFHPSYLITWLCVGLLIGLALSRSGLGITSELLVVSLSVAGISSFRRRRWWSIVLLTFCGVVIGLWRGAVLSNELQIYKNYARAEVLVSGEIYDDPTYSKSGDQRFVIKKVTLNDRHVPGSIYVGTFSILDVKRGDTVTLAGKLQDGFGSYQASLKYAQLLQATASNNRVREFRDTFAAGVRNIVAEPAASLGLGFVVGQRSALPDTLDDQLRIVGLTHIVVASGYNLTILVRFTRRLLAKHSKYLAAATSAALMAGFVAISGLSPSMTRAALVTGLSLMAWYYGRRFHPLQLIFFVAAITAIWNPIYLWADIGWYLSFLAFAGVLMLAPLLSAMIWRNNETPAIGQLIVETVAAQLMTLPLILMVFGQLPVLSLIANMLVAPVIPLAMLVTALAGVVGLVGLDAFAIVGLVTNYVVGYVVVVVEWLAAYEWSQIEILISPFVMAICYAFVMLLGTLLYLKTRYDFRATSVVD